MMSAMADRARLPASDVRLDPVLDFLRLLWSIEHRLQAASKRMHAELGITGPQRLVLRIVSRFPGISAGDLAEIVHLHPSTITGVVQRLVDKGLLARDRDPRDTRRVRLRPRAAAARYTRAAAGTVEGAVAGVLRRVPAARLRQTRGVLAAISVALDAADAAR
jgi:MarR family transcriptional regulator, organic hydroperoxide resistance regulator